MRITVSNILLSLLLALCGPAHATVRFDDQAEKMVGRSVTAGAFQPVDALAALNGRDMFGDYVLSIIDAVFEDPLEFFSASLDIVVTDVPADVPEPGGLALLGLGLLGLWFWRKKKVAP